MSYWRSWSDSAHSGSEHNTLAGGAIVLVTACLIQVVAVLRSRRPAPTACHSERMLPVNKFTHVSTPGHHTLDMHMHADHAHAAAPPRRSVVREAIAMPINGVIPGAEYVPIRANENNYKRSLKFGMEEPDVTDYDDYAALKEMFGGDNVVGLYRPGDMIEGTIISVSTSGVMMDAGMKDY